MGGERPLIQISWPNELKEAFFIRAHRLPPLSQGWIVSIGYEEDETFKELRTGGFQLGDLAG